MTTRWRESLQSQLAPAVQPTAEPGSHRGFQFVQLLSLSHLIFHDSPACRMMFGSSEASAAGNTIIIIIIICPSPLKNKLGAIWVLAQL